MIGRRIVERAAARNARRDERRNQPDRDPLRSGSGGTSHTSSAGRPNARIERDKARKAAALKAKRSAAARKAAATRKARKAGGKP